MLPSKKEKKNRFLEKCCRSPNRAVSGRSQGKKRKCKWITFAFFETETPSRGAGAAGDAWLERGFFQRSVAVFAAAVAAGTAAESASQNAPFFGGQREPLGAPVVGAVRQRARPACNRCEGVASSLCCSIAKRYRAATNNGRRRTKMQENLRKRTAPAAGSRCPGTATMWGSPGRGT